MMKNWITLLLLSFSLTSLTAQAVVPKDLVGSREETEESKTEESSEREDRIEGVEILQSEEVRDVLSSLEPLNSLSADHLINIDDLDTATPEDTATADNEEVYNEEVDIYGYVDRELENNSTQNNTPAKISDEDNLEASISDLEASIKEAIEKADSQLMNAEQISVALEELDTEDQIELLFKLGVIKSMEEYGEINKALGLDADKSILVAVPAAIGLNYVVHKAIAGGKSVTRFITPNKISLSEAKAQVKARTKELRQFKQNLLAVEDDYFKKTVQTRVASGIGTKIKDATGKAVAGAKEAVHHASERIGNSAGIPSVAEQLKNQDTTQAQGNAFDEGVEKERLDQQKKENFEADKKVAEERIAKAKQQLAAAQDQLDKVASSKKGIFRKLGRLIRGSAIGVLSLGGIAVYAVVAGDLLYIGLDTVEDMDELKGKYERDVERILKRVNKFRN